MYFQLDDKMYRVKFYRMGNTTIAELLELGSCEGDNPYVSLELYGVASTYHKDIFNKSTGRKVALAKLLDAMDTLWGTEENAFLTKSDRTMIWARYFETHKK